MPDERNGGVVFDVDGTLLDTNYLHVAAWWEAFRERGHEIRCADVHRALGMGSAELVERVLGQPDPSVSAAHSRHYAPYLGRIRPLPGAADLLRATARLGLDAVLATSAKDDEVDLMTDALGAGSAVTTVVSSGDVERAKPGVRPAEVHDVRVEPLGPAVRHHVRRHVGRRDIQPGGGEVGAVLPGARSDLQQPTAPLLLQPAQEPC